MKIEKFVGFTKFAFHVFDRDKNGLIYVALDVDDNLLIGNEKAIKHAPQARCLQKKIGFFSQHRTKPYFLLAAQ